ncbi:hypothetical protein OROGR_003920 [Orobanche gracilis]
MLRTFARKVFSIVPHGGPCERIFSTLGLIKTKPRKRQEVSSLNMIAQIKCDLATQVQIKTKPYKPDFDITDGLSMADFDIAEECDHTGEDLLDEEIVDVQVEDLSSTIGIMERLFDFESFEIYYI